MSNKYGRALLVIASYILASLTQEVSPGQFLAERTWLVDELATLANLEQARVSGYNLCWPRAATQFLARVTVLSEL